MLMLATLWRSFPFFKDPTHRERHVSGLRALAHHALEVQHPNDVITGGLHLLDGVLTILMGLRVLEDTFGDAKQVTGNPRIEAVVDLAGRQ